MSHASRDQYLETKILTASQPKLHAMLLEGAIRFGHQAESMWTSDVDFAEVDAVLARMSDIMDELTHGAAAGTEKVSPQFEEQYAFIYRELIASRFNEDREKLLSSLSLLEYQRETWRLACEKMEAEIEPEKPTIPSRPNPPHIHLGEGLVTESLSLEA